MKFTIYSKRGCPYCSKIKDFLSKVNLQYTTYTLGSDYTREEFYSKFGMGSTFPQVLCDEQKLGGCVDTIKYLRENKFV